MRLSSEQVKQGILHPDKRVRDDAVHYFSGSFSQDPAVMPAAIQAIEKYGWQNGISDYAFGEGLVQTEESIVWLLTETRRVGDPDDPAWSDYEAEMRRLLAVADAQLLHKYEAELSSVGLTDTDFRAAIHDRIRLLAADPETSWARAGTLLRACQRSGVCQRGQAGPGLLSGRGDRADGEPFRRSGARASPTGYPGRHPPDDGLDAAARGSVGGRDAAGARGELAGRQAPRGLRLAGRGVPAGGSSRSAPTASWRPSPTPSPSPPGISGCMRPVRSRGSIPTDR